MMKLLAFFLLLFVAVRANVWTNAVLQFQRQAAETQPIDQLSLPCAHNTFNNPSNLPALLVEYENLILFKGKIIFENQELTITQLLNLGVRHIQLEAHYIPEYNQTWLCHSAPEIALICPFVESATGQTCEQVLNIQDLGINTGCTKDARSWESGVIEVAKWVKSNPQEFLIIEVIDFASNITGANETQFAGPIIQYLGPFLVTAANLSAVSTSTQKPWPSIQDLRTAVNRSVILIGVLPIFTSIIPYIISTPPNLIEVNNFNPQNCSGISNPVFDFVYEDNLVLDIDILGFDISASGSDTVGVFTSSLYPQVLGCGFSACADRIDSNNIANFVWSWSGNSSQIACQPDLCAAMSNGQWTQLSCSQNLFEAACQSLSNPSQWKLSGSKSQGNQNVICPSGYIFSYPQTPLINTALQSLANGANIWLNVTLSYQPNNPICTYVPPSSASSLMASVTSVVFGFLLLQFFNRL